MNDRFTVKHVARNFALAILFAVVVGPVASAALLTPIASPAGFVSPTTYANDFETAINLPQFTFDATAELELASILSRGVTSSGVQGLKEFDNRTNPNGPLNVTFAAPVHEIGMFFGNDDFNFQFNAILEVFDAANVSLGNVQVAVNRNDFVDQYLGVRSDTPIQYAAISYQRTQAQQLAVYIDDFRIGTVPEPTGAVLVLAGLLSLAAGIRFIR
jgi:hypothetical protein